MATVVNSSGYRQLDSSSLLFANPHNDYHSFVAHAGDDPPPNELLNSECYNHSIEQIAHERTDIKLRQAIDEDETDSESSATECLLKDHEQQEKKNKSRKPYASILIVFGVSLIVGIIVTLSIVLTIWLLSSSSQQTYSFSSLPQQRYNVLLDSQIKGSFTKEAKLSVSYGTIDPISVWLVNKIHTNWTTTTENIPVYTGQLTSPFYALPDSTISIDIINTIDLAEDNITISVHRLNYIDPYCKESYIVHSMPTINFNCQIQDAGFYEVFVESTNSSNVMQLIIALHIKGVDFLNSEESCLLTQSKTCCFDLHFAKTYLIAISFSELTSFKLELQLEQRMELYSLVGLGLIVAIILFTVSICILLCCKKTHQS